MEIFKMMIVLQKCVAMAHVVAGAVNKSMPNATLEEKAYVVLKVASEFEKQIIKNTDNEKRI